MSAKDEFAKKTFELVIVQWEGKLHCAYLNDHRIAGGKPWGGGSTAKSWTVTGEELLSAIPELTRLA